MARTNKWIKRGLWVAVLAVVGGAAAGGVFYHRLHGTPDWYEEDTTTPEQRVTAAGEAKAKLVAFYNWVAGTGAAEARVRRGKADPSAANARSAAVASAMLAAPENQARQIEFTDAQLNGIFHTWAEYRDRRAMLEQYVENPRLVIRDGQLIVVGKAKQMDLVLSLIFEPKIGADGKLDMELAHVMGGMLPLPKAVWGPQREAVRRTLARRLPEYQQAARLDAKGLANGAAASAAMNEMLLDTLADRPTPAVVFVPVEPPKLAPTMPVRITAVAMKDHALTLTAEPMSVENRKALIEQVRSAGPNGAGKPVSD